MYFEKSLVSWKIWFFNFCTRAHTKRKKKKKNHPSVMNYVFFYMRPPPRTHEIIFSKWSPKEKFLVPPLVVCNHFGGLTWWNGMELIQKHLSIWLQNPYCLEYVNVYFFFPPPNVTLIENKCHRCEAHFLSFSFSFFLDSCVFSKLNWLFEKLHSVPYKLIESMEIIL